MIYDRVVDECKQLDKKIAYIHEELKGLPDGKFTCNRNGNRYKWFCKRDDQLHYIPKKEREYAKKLARKRFLTEQLEDCLDEKRALEYYVRHHKKKVSRAERLLAEQPEYKNLLEMPYESLSKELISWTEEEYHANPQYPEGLVYMGTSGCKVRSKAELLIETFLHEHQIPFRYECELMLGNTPVFPDFTIRHPQTGDTYYWEHFGMMDDFNYVQKSLFKLQNYMMHGIMPSQNLIITFEKKDAPISGEVIERLIKQYFV